MTIDELNKILDRISHHGKKTYWAKELRRRIQNWDWQNPHDPSFHNKVAVGKPAAGFHPLRTTNDLILSKLGRYVGKLDKSPSLYAYLHRKRESRKEARYEVTLRLL